MNIHKTLTIFFMALTGFQIAAMQQPNLRQQLINAAYNGNYEQVEKLMSAGAPVDPKALFHAAENGNYDIVKTIFECGVDPESPANPNQLFARSTLFTYLLLNQELLPLVKEKLIKLYLKHGADIRLQGPAGMLLPIHGVHKFDFNTLKLLVEQADYAKAQDNHGSTALMTLAWISSSLPPVTSELEKIREQEHIKKAKLLIQYGADVNLQDENGETCLMIATRHGNKSLVELFLENGADVNLKDECGETCLMKAIRLGNKSLVELLLEKDANVNLKTTAGKSALDCAEDLPEIMKLLKDAQKTTSKKY